MVFQNEDPQMLRLSKKQILGRVLKMSRNSKIDMLKQKAEKELKEWKHMITEAVQKPHSESG